MRINSIEDLAKHIGSKHHTEKSIAQYLYDGTTCGVSFNSDEEGVKVGGYCEGVDNECLTHTLKWGFTGSEFLEILQKADKDGCDLWDETHGCHQCKSRENPDGTKPVDNECPRCLGKGIVL